MPQNLPLDPIQWYLKYPAFFDFLIFWILFGLLVRTALINVKKLKKHGGDYSSFSHGGKKSTEDKLEGGIAAIVGLALALAVMAYGKFSLKSFFVSGFGPALIGLFAGFMAYSGFSSHFKKEKEDEISVTAIISAFFVGVIVFSLLNYKPAGTNISSLIFMFVVIILVYLLVTKGKLLDTTDKDASRLSRDLASDGNLDRLGNNVNNGSNAARDCESKVSSLTKALNLAKRGSVKLADVIKDLVSKRRLLAAAFSAAILLLPTHSPGQIRAELLKTYNPVIVRTVMNAVSKYGASATPAQIVDPADAAAFSKELENAAQYCELLEQEAKNYVASLQKVYTPLKTSIPEDYFKLKEFMNTIKRDLNDIISDVDGLVTRANNLKDAALIAEATALKTRVENFTKTTIADDDAFKSKAESAVPILSSDSATVQNSIALIENHFAKIRDVSQKLNASLSELKGAGAGSVDIEKFKSIVSEYDSVLNALQPAIETARHVPDTALALLTNISKDISAYKNAAPKRAIDWWLPDLKKLNDKITLKETGGKGLKAEVAGIITSTDNAQKAVSMVESYTDITTLNPTDLSTFGSLCSNGVTQITTLGGMITGRVLPKVQALAPAAGTPEKELLDLLNSYVSSPNIIRTATMNLGEVVNMYSNPAQGPVKFADFKREKYGDKLTALLNELKRIEKLLP